MLIFAFCIAGLGIMIIKMVFDKTIQSAQGFAANKKKQEMNNFVRSIKASEKEIEEAKGNMDYSDVIEDIRYIKQKEVTELQCHTLIKGCKKFYTLPLRWDQMAMRIRLAKIGKLDDDFDYRFGIDVYTKAQYFPELKRYYEVLAKNFTEAGVPMSVVFKHSYYNMDDMRVITLSRFV